MRDEPAESQTLTIVVPTLNEAAGIRSTLHALQPLRRRGVEIIVCDGGSNDATLDSARDLCDAAILAPRGRASQMNAGAAVAKSDVFLFLHADTRLPEATDTIVKEFLRDPALKWGRFDVAFDSPRLSFRIIAAFMNARSRWSGIASGDQAIFVRRDTFKALSGFPDIPLMEDIAFSKRLRVLAPPLCRREKVVTSARRWERNGVASTVIMMWGFRLAFWIGVSPSRLAALYGYPRRDEA